MPIEEDQRTILLKNKLLASLQEEQTRTRMETDNSDVTSHRGVNSQSSFYSELSPVNYNSSTFPSLFSNLGTNTNRSQKKKKVRQLKSKDPEDDATPHKHKETAPLSFGEHMRRRNEGQWLRIEAVAKENLEKYEKRARDIYLKVRQQRETINKRSEMLLESLARMEEKKREEHLYQSIHGRMWRHHRSLQRRAYNLEPLRPPSNMSAGVSLQQTHGTEAEMAA